MPICHEPMGRGVISTVTADEESIIVASPRRVPADNATISRLTVTRLDAAGSPIPFHSISVSATSNATGVTVIGSPALTRADGVAVFGLKSSTEHCGPNGSQTDETVLTITDVTDSKVLSSTYRVAFGPITDAAQSEFFASLAIGDIDTLEGAELTVKCKDSNGDPVVSPTVCIEPVTNADNTRLNVIHSRLPHTEATDPLGRIVPDVYPLELPPTPGGDVVVKVTDIDSEVEITEQATFHYRKFVDDSTSTLEVSSAQCCADGVSTRTVTLTCKDSAGQTVADAICSLAATQNGTGVTIVGGEQASDANGVVTWTVKSDTVHDGESPTEFTANIEDQCNIGDNPFDWLILDTVEVEFLAPVSVESVTLDPNAGVFTMTFSRALESNPTMPVTGLVANSDTEDLTLVFGGSSVVSGTTWVLAQTDGTQFLGEGDLVSYPNAAGTLKAATGEAVPAFSDVEFTEV